MTVEFSPRLLPGTGTPVDQPLLARCGICNEWCVYGVTLVSHSTGGPNQDGGIILQAWCDRGAAWVLAPDGTYLNRKNTNKTVWGQRGHRCPQKALMALRADDRLHWRTENPA